MLKDFSDKNIISLLGSRTRWCKRACKEIINRKDDFIPLLLNVLDEAITKPELFAYEEKNGTTEHIPAALLLAQFRVHEAYPRLVNLISYSEDLANRLWGNILLDGYVPVLRDTFNGEAFLLPHLMEEKSVSHWSRAMAVRAWGMHYYDGFLTREEICGCFRRLIHDVYADSPGKEGLTVLTFIAHTIRKQQLEELIDDVKAIYQKSGINEFLEETLDEFISSFNDPKHKAKDFHVDNTIGMLEELKWFSGEKSDAKDSGYNNESGESRNFEESKFNKKPDEIGRNSPCSCDSGRKYKNCCLVR
ncbi:MAG: DUF1186 domain-containing protein [Treponema sp.]|nr:DUF1186 domain-containing protein [Treponema sp.]